MELLRRRSGGKAGLRGGSDVGGGFIFRGLHALEPHTPIDTRRRDRVATHQVGYTPSCGRSERQFEAVPRSCGPTSRLSLPPRDEHVEIAREALRGTARGHRLRFRASRATAPSIRLSGVAASHSVKLGLRPRAARGRSCRVGNASARCGSGTRQRESGSVPQDGTDPRDRHAHRVSRRARSAYRLFFPNR